MRNGLISVGVVTIGAGLGLLKVSYTYGIFSVAIAGVTITALGGLVLFNGLSRTEGEEDGES